MPGPTPRPFVLVAWGLTTLAAALGGHLAHSAGVAEGERRSACPRPAILLPAPEEEDGFFRGPPEPETGGRRW